MSPRILDRTDDHDLRIECLKLACSVTADERVVALAQDFYAFARGDESTQSLPEHSQLQDFFDRCDALAKRMGIARATLSDRLLFDGRRLDLIAAGKDIGVRRLWRAEADLAALEREAGAA